jgi:hypothetical protein
VDSPPHAASLVLELLSYIYHSPQGIVTDISGHVDQGYAENVHGYMSTWPRGTDGRCTITYCYNNYAMKERFQDYVGEAVKLWTDALGEPDSDGGHCVDLKEFTLPNGKSEFCRDEVEVWHDHVPAETPALFINN